MKEPNKILNPMLLLFIIGDLIMGWVAITIHSFQHIIMFVLLVVTTLVEYKINGLYVPKEEVTE